ILKPPRLTRVQHTTCFHKKIITAKLVYAKHSTSWQCRLPQFVCTKKLTESEFFCAYKPDSVSTRAAPVQLSRRMVIYLGDSLPNRSSGSLGSVLTHMYMYNQSKRSRARPCTLVRI